MLLWRLVRDPFSCRVLDESLWRAELARALPTGYHKFRVYDDADGSSLVVVDHPDLASANGFKRQLEGWPFSWAEHERPGPYVLRRAEGSRGI
jgi:hypothetical protein